jgi:hypothetical protein
MNANTRFETLARPRYPKGTQFVRMGQKNTQTVVDYFVTRNMAGDIVRARYLCHHTVCGQIVTDSDITETSIKRAEIVLIPQPKNPSAV